MPTAKPIINARLGAVEDTVATFETRYTPMEPTTTPLSALSSGRPAANSDPNVTARIAKAITMPRTVDGPGLDDTEPYALPPTCAVTPACSAGPVALTSAGKLRESKSVRVTVYWTSASAARPSEEIALDVNGSITAATWGAFLA